VNGIPFEVKEPENGFLVPYGDTKAMEEKILNLLDNKKLAEEISKNNFKKAQEYDWDIIYKKYMQEYKYLLKTKK